MSRRDKYSMLRIALFGLPLLLVLLLSSSAWWLLKTSSGAAWLWNYFENAAAGSVRSHRLDGDLASGLVIHGLEYRAGTVELSIRKVEIKAVPGVWPLAIRVPSLVLQDVEITNHSAGGQAQDSGDGVHIPTMLEALQLPVAVYVQAAEFNGITLRAEGEPPEAIVESLKFSAALDDELVIEQFTVVAPGIEAHIEGQLALQAPYDVSIAMRGQIEALGGAGMPGLIFPFKLDSSGELENMQFTLASTDHGLEFGDEHLELDVSGRLSATGVGFDRLGLTGSNVDLYADGAVNWSPGKQAGLNLAIRRLDLSPWLQDWPAGERLLGSLELNWSESGLQIQHGELGVAGTDLAITLSADFDLAANTVKGYIDWSDLDWPLTGAPTGFSSPSGRLTVSGSPDQWQAAGGLDIRMGDYPQARLEILGGGDRTSARMAIPGGEVLGGNISGEVGVDWQDALAWDLRVFTNRIDPEPLIPGWPGHLDMEVEARSGTQSEPLRIRLVSMGGSIRGIPLSGRGDFSLAGDVMTFERVGFDDVELSTDEAVLQLDGTASNPAGVSLKFNGRLPSGLLEGASGSIDLEGRYSSDAGNSILDVHLQALDLNWNGFSAREVSVNTQSIKGSGPVPGMQLHALGLMWRDTMLDEFSVALEPAGERFRLEADLAAGSIAMTTALTLAPENQHDPFGHPWQGEIDTLDLTAGEAYVFELQARAPLEWDFGSVSLSPLCVRETSGANFCVNGYYKAASDWSLVTDVATVPLDYLRDALDLGVRFEQYLEGRLEWHQANGQSPTGGADFRISPGRILEADDNYVLAESSEGKFGFSLNKGNLESGVLDIELPGNGFIDMDFKVMDIAEANGGDLEGHVVARLDDLGLIGHLVLPAVDDIDGQFESDIQLGGKLANPSIDGVFNFSNGLVRYSPVGLTLKNIELDGQLEKNYRGSLNGKFQVGEGVGSIDGHVLFEDIENLQADISFSGDRLLLVNTDDLKISTETDLKIGLSQQRVDIDGYIRIPSAQLTPTNLLVDKVGDSEDLLVEDHDKGATTSANKKQSETEVYGRLEVAFGDDVQITVPGVETTISGSVVYNWQGDPVPLANGSYRLNGKVDVYGPDLAINNGAISFPTVPADNPLLNIRAEREIFGNTQIRAAGVQVIGTLKRPVVEAYTVPVTNEDRAWTLLVTGTDFDQSQGVGGFDVGTYIAPKLYVSYGISLFEDENVISARYDLKKSFGIKITSGQRETGADVSYTIDK